MSVLSVRNVLKQYGDYKAVNNLSFEVPKQSIFGLLGPNGAGKTSLIRIITRITGADSGEILLDGQPLHSAKIRDIGYMPEERGLYKKMKVGEHLMYLAQLRELSPKEAKSVIDHWMEKFDITDWWGKKIEELSKGMQQKIQFIATVMHNPSLIILDEPFTGLDPINTNLIKDEIFRMNDEGTSIIFSTHRMEQVEEICRDIVLINEGQKIMEGKMDQVKQNHKEHLFELEYGHASNTLPKGEGYNIKEDKGDFALLQIENEIETNKVLSQLIQKGVSIHRFEERLPTLNEIFIKRITG